MRIKLTNNKGFTLVETVIAMGVLSIGVVAVLEGIGVGIKIVQSSRNRTTATQVIAEKTETIRLLAWDQIATVPTNFTNGIYTGTINFSPVSFATTYSSNMVEATITVQWDNWGRPQSETWTTYVAKHGLHDYVY